MAKFFVGQRVRVNMPRSTEHGKETVIKELNVQLQTFSGHRVDLRSKFPTPEGIYLECIFEPHELEPITDRNEVVTWESCAWSPHGVSV